MVLRAKSAFNRVGRKKVERVHQRRNGENRRRKAFFETLESRELLAAFMPGSIQGQDGWSGGTIAISASVDQAVDQSGALSRTGVGAFRISNGTQFGNHNGAFNGWVFGPGLSASAGQPSSGAQANLFTATFWIKAGSSVADGSNMEIDLGTIPGDDRNTFLALTNRADADGGLQVRMSEPDGVTGNFKPTQIVATGLSRTAWHKMEITAKFYDGPGNDTFEVKLNGTTLINPLTSGTTWGTFEGWRNGNSFPYALSNRLFFRSGAAPSGFGVFSNTGAQGFLIDDLGYQAALQSNPNSPLAYYAAAFEAQPTVTFADDSWGSLSANDPIADADGATPGNQPAIFGVDAFLTVQAAVNSVAAGGTVIANAGTYVENVTLNKNVTLRSTGGRAVTTIQGVSGVGALGTVLLDGVTTSVQIGAPAQGFTIIGIDNGNPGIENAAVYIRGNHSNTQILDNEIRANGDHGLLGEYGGATINNMVISGNEFSGQTFSGAQPGGIGFGSQFTTPNVPRQLVTLGNGGGMTGALVSNLTFTNNFLSGTAGGISSVDNISQQGNTLATIDAVNSTITGNTFAGTTSLFGSALRVRRPGTTISGNTFNTSNMTPSTNLLFVQNNSTSVQDIIAANLPDRGAMLVGGTTVWQAIQAAVLAAPSAGGTVRVLPSATAYAENVNVNNAAGTLTSLTIEAPTGPVTIDPTSGDAFTIPNGVTARFTNTVTTLEPVVVLSGGTIGGTGTITGPVNVNAGGFVSPGFSPGILNTGNYTQAGTLNIEIVRPATTQVPGVDHDQVNVTGTVNLSGPLSLIFTGPAGLIANNTPFLIINNDSNDSVTGTFNGLANGATFTANGQDWVVFYNGGDGNDVVISTVTAPMPNTVYVEDTAWNALANGSVIADADFTAPGNQPAILGYNAFKMIQPAVNAVAISGTVIVNAGTYVEDVQLNKNGLQLRGAGPGNSIISGPIGGIDGATVRIAGNNLDVGGFTITREGNNTTDWNNGNLNFAGIAVNAPGLTGVIIHDNLITGNRTAIDINNTSGFTIRNNVVTNNHTGLFFRNQTDNHLVEENEITNNRTVGVLFLDASGGTNSPVQTALGSTFTNNHISGNWYGQVVDRQSGGSLPVPGTTNLKNVSGNWFGTTSPVITTANSAEPGYASLIPVVFGGSATPPGGQPDIAGSASANIIFNPLLSVGTDTNVETVPGRGTYGFQGNQANLTIVPAATPNAVDNDYTRIAGAVAYATNGTTINLVGTFNWTEANAAASWAKGNDGLAGTTTDNYSLLIPANLNNITFTSASLGSARIQGPGDLSTENLEGVFVFDGGDNQNWTISNLEIFDFDLSIGFFNGAGGSDAYNGTQILNNHIRIPADLNVVAAPADVNQNIGIHYSFGANQTIQNNLIDFVAGGISNGASFSSSVGMQSNTSGGNVYNGLLIDNNTLTVLNAQSANPETILGIWENGHAHSSNITVSNNDFVNVHAGNDPSLNLQRAFRVTSHSSGSSTVTYSNNTVTGANMGFQWLASSNFAGNQPVAVTGNTLTNVGTGFLLQSNGVANFLNNSISGIATGVGYDLNTGNASVSGGSVNGLATGVRVSSASVTNLANVDFDDVTDNATDMQLLATAGTVTIGTNNQFGGNTFFIDNASTNSLNLAGSGATYDEVDNYRIEDKMHHRVDTDLALTTGLVTWVANNVYVTNGGTDNSIQRGIDAALTGNTVNIEAGSYTGGADAVIGGKNINLAPGSSPAQVFLTGNLVLNAGDTLTIEVDGTNAATDYDNFVVTGSVTFGGATLNLLQSPASAHTPVLGQTFTLISNDAADAVSGTFAGLPAGSTVMLNGQPLKVFYTGNDGNDVILTYATPTVTYAEDTAWTGFVTGQFIADADFTAPGNQPAIFGYDAFSTVQAAVNAVVATGGTTIVNPGTYNEDVTLSGKTNFLLQGAGAASTTISGVLGGGNDTLIIFSNQIIDGFTITRALGVGENNIGVAFASGSTGSTLRNSTLTGNRTAIYMNGSGNSATITRNVINDNRTGMLFADMNHGTHTITENFITNNRTFGLLLLPSITTWSSATVISNNSISGNFASQLENNSAASSVNASGNWWGTNDPTYNPIELNAVLPPVFAYPGPALPPGSPFPYHISGSNAAGIDFTPHFNTGTDTAPATAGFQGDFADLVVHAVAGQTGATGRITEAIGLLTSTGTVTVRTGSYTENVNTAGKAVTLAPGLLAGQVTLTGNLTLDANDFLAIEVDGTAAAQYDGFAVNGTVALGGATLNLLQSPTSSYTPVPGDVYTIINNDTGADAVSGTFNGLANGSTILLNGQTLEVYYTGNDGNDVILAHQTPTTGYVDDAWTAFVNGTFIADADLGTSGNQPAVFGLNAFATINSALTTLPTSGTVIINGGTYAELVNVNGTQTIEITGPDAAQSVIIEDLATLSGTTLVLEGSSILTFGDGDARTLAGVINGSGNLTKQGTGNVTISNAANGYTGITTINAGTISISNDLNLGAVPGVATPGKIVINGGTLRNHTSTVTLNANRGIALGPSGGTIVSANSGANFNYNGIIADQSSAASLTVGPGSGIFVPGGQSTYTGGTILSSGSVTVPTASSSGPAGAPTSGPYGTGTITFNGGGFRSTTTIATTIGNNISFDANTTVPTGGADKVLTLSGTMTLTGNRTLTINSVANVVISGAIVGGFGITKAGTTAGAIVMSGPNTYSGTTTVSGGTLLVNGTNSGAGAVNVNTGATLGGTGSITGPVTVNGTLNAGSPVNGTESLATGSLLVNTGGVFTPTINNTTAVTGYDQVLVTGTVNLTGATLTLAGTHVPNPAAAQSFIVISNDGADAVTGTFAGLPEGSPITFNGQTLFVSYAGNDGNDVVLYSQPTVNGGAGADTLVLRQVSGNPALVEFSLNGAAFIQVTSGSPFTFNGQAGNDLMLVDTSHGDPISTGNTFFVGEILRIQKNTGVASDTATYSPTAAGTGAVSLTGFGSVNFTGTNSVDFVNLTSVIVNSATANDTLAIADGNTIDNGGTVPGAYSIAAANAMVVTGASTSVAIRNVTTATLDTVAGGTNGNDAVTINTTTGSHLVANLNVTTGSGTDAVTVSGPLTVSGNIDISSQNIAVNALLTAGAANTVTLNAGTGAITTGSAAVDISAQSLIASASTGIDLDTTVTNLTASNSGAGNINLDETNGANVLNVAASNGTTTITTLTGNLNVTSVAASASVTLTSTAGSITDANAAASNVAGASLTATAGTGIDLDTTIVTLTSASVTGTGAIDISDTAGGMSVTSATTNDGAITLNATGGNLTLTTVTAGGTANVVATTTTSGNILVGLVTATGDTISLVSAGNVQDANAAANNIASSNLVATAVSGIGAGDTIETTIANLEASGGTGGVFIANSGALTIGGIGATNGLSATGGDIVVSTTGGLTIGEHVTATGAGTDVTLTSLDAAAAGQNIVLNGAITLSSALASVTLNAGDNATISGNITSGTTTTINVDFGDAESVASTDAVSGGQLNITGVITTPVVGSGGGTFLNGNDDFDTFTFNPQTTTEFRVHGFAPSATLAGDTLVMNVSGTTGASLITPGSIAPYTGPGSGTWSFTSGHRPVLFGSIEQTTITGPYHLTYDNGIAPVGNLVVMRDAGQTNLQIRDGSTGGPILFQGSLGVIQSLRILGSSGDDMVTVDDINTLVNFTGTVPSAVNNPNITGTGEFMFDGLGGSDTLVYNINGTTASQTYAIGNSSGSAGLQGEIESIAAGVNLLSYFQNVELTQRTGIGSSPGALTLLGDSGVNNFATQANGTATRTTIAGYTPFEFSGNNYSTFNIDALGSGDSIDLVSFGTAQTNNWPINLSGGDGNDTIRVRNTSGNTGLVSLHGNAGDDLFQLFDGTTPATNTVNNIAGQVIVDGTDGNVGGNTDTLTIIDSGDNSADSVLISAVNSGSSADYAVEGINSVGPNDVILRRVDVLNYTGTSANDTIDAQLVNTVPLHDLSVVNLSGWVGADQFYLFTSDQYGGTSPTPTPAASGVASVSLYGDAPGNPNAVDGNDIFGATPAGLIATGIMNVGLVVPDTTRMIRPSATTSIAIDGGQPTGPFPPMGDIVGDKLNADISALPNTNPVVVSTFQPGTVVANGIQPFTWTQIEDMNLVDQGKLTNVQMGDLFARTTPGQDLIQLSLNPTALNPHQVRLRINATLTNYSASNKTIMYGGGMNDTITQSNLTIPAEFYGEGGDDVLSGAMNNDWLVGGLGNDRINGSGGNNVIWGDNAPTLPSDPQPQDLAVGGNDTLSGLGGADVFYGGGGNDSVSAGGGNDYAYGGQGDDSLDGNDGDDRMYGGLGNDIVTGHNGNDLLSAGEGNDFLYGNQGNDVLLAGNGEDLMDGGDGNDLLVSGNVANEHSSWVSLANTSTYSPATYVKSTDNDAALLTLLAQWGTSSNRSSIGAITHDGQDDDIFGGLGDDDFCWELPDIMDDFPAASPPDYLGTNMGNDERFAPTA